MDEYIRNEIERKLIKFIKENLDLNWKWDFISKNPFTKEYNDLKEKYTKAIEKIEEWWLKVNYDPMYKKCRDTRWNEFQECLQN